MHKSVCAQSFSRGAPQIFKKARPSPGREGCFWRKNMHKKLIAVALAAGFGFTCSANAAFVVVPQQQTAIEQSQHVTQEEYVPSESDITIGGGYDFTGNQPAAQAAASSAQGYKNGKQAVSLAEAMQLVAPAGWRGFSDPTLNWNYPVEVNVKGDWRESLRELSARYNLIFRLNEKTKRMYVESGPGGIRDNIGDTIHENLVGELPKPAVYEAVYEGRPFLQIRKGQRVPEALELFLAQHNMKLIWDAGSQPVLRDDVNFNGPIEDILTELLGPLNYHATIYAPSRTVVVKTLSQSVADMRYDNDVHTH